jgi:hypothetical protein
MRSTHDPAAIAFANLVARVVRERAVHAPPTMMGDGMYGYVSSGHTRDSLTGELKAAEAIVALNGRGVVAGRLTRHQTHIVALETAGKDVLVTVAEIWPGNPPGYRAARKIGLVDLTHLMLNIGEEEIGSISGRLVDAWGQPTVPRLR